MTAPLMPPIQVRLSDDATDLQILIAPSSTGIPPEALVTLIRERCAEVSVQLRLSVPEVDSWIQAHGLGVWGSITTGHAATLPTDGRVELVVPVPVFADGQRARRLRCAVHAGDTLARIVVGQPGKPGRDLLNRATEPRLPRVAHLPAGANTQVSDGGRTLIAVCDGEVVLRNLALQVDPMYVHDGDVTASNMPIPNELPLFVTGTVRAGVVLESDWDIHVQGDAQRCEVRSRLGTVTIGGSVSGSMGHISIVHAGMDVVVRDVEQARIESGRHAFLNGRAARSSFVAKGNMYLQGSIDESLVDTLANVEGGVIPLPESLFALRDVEAERKHFRVSTRLEGHIALHGAADLTFYPCTVIDLSVGGALCQTADVHVGDWSVGTIVQLKFTLPAAIQHILVVAEVSRQVSGEVIGLSFLQMSQSDQDRVTDYCLQLLMARGHTDFAARHDRSADRE